MDKKTALGLLGVVVVGASFYFLGAGNFLMSESQVQQEAVVLPAFGEAEVTEALVGKWRSVDDPRFMREFMANGTVVDSYEGYPEATISGTWFVYTDATAPDNLMFEAQGTYVQIIADGQAYNFGVAGIDEATLDLIYMELGGVLSFSKVE